MIDHGTEAHLLADILAARDIPVIIGPLFTSRSKVELRNRSLANPAGSPRRASPSRSRPTTRWCRSTSSRIRPRYRSSTAWPAHRAAALTINPARIIGIDDRLGTLEPGKDADLVIWSGDPLDVLSRVERAFISGAEIYTAGGSPEWAGLR